MVIHLTFCNWLKAGSHSPFTSKGFPGVGPNARVSYNFKQQKKVTFLLLHEAFSKLVDNLSIHLHYHFPRNTTGDADAATLKPIVCKAILSNASNTMFRRDPLEKCHVDVKRHGSTYEADMPNN